MKVPIKQIFQQQFKEKLEQNYQEQAIVAFKICNPKKDPKYSVVNGKLLDEIEEEVDTTGLHLFEKEKNDEIFKSLNLDQSIWDCCSNGKNITLFSFGDKCKQLSQIFNKTGVNADQKPGIIRLAVESIFAFIFHDSSSEFVIKIQYIEINNQQTFDLLNLGKNQELKDISSKNCVSIEDILENKSESEKYRLYNMMPKNENVNSTLIFKIMVESIPKSSLQDYKTTDQKVRVMHSQFTFVELSELSEINGVIR